jgi:hypothetical protein
MMTDLQYVGWYVLTVLCMFAVGAIRQEAVDRKWLHWFLIPPGAVLLYEAWYVFKKIGLEVWHNWQFYFFVLWVGLTYYLWERGNEYKRQLKQERFVEKKGLRKSL